MAEEERHPVSVVWARQRSHRSHPPSAPSAGDQHTVRGPYQKPEEPESLVISAIGSELCGAPACFLGGALPEQTTNATRRTPQGRECFFYTVSGDARFSGLLVLSGNVTNSGERETVGAGVEIDPKIMSGCCASTGKSGQAEGTRKSP